MIERWEIIVQGVIQGVGFRPSIHRLASRLGLVGWVRNTGGQVTLQIEGPSEACAELLQTLRHGTPAPSRVERIEAKPIPPRGESDFRIFESEAVGGADWCLAPDLATCDDCLQELFQPNNPRYHHPFITCTACGPRYTITRALPFDRERTSMVEFQLCENCLVEYHDPTNRRFHAETISCPRCGPTLLFLSRKARESPVLDNEAALNRFADAITAGAIGLLKGVGGYHLLCDARDDSLVRELRRRKTREAKPLAILVASLEAARRLANVEEHAARRLTSPERPIVLLPKKAGDQVAPSVAPATGELGLLLPYTPIHALLFHRLGDIPLVLTSGNGSNEPITTDEADAAEKLNELADVLLGHHRRIVMRCDDSVVRAAPNRIVPIRRSRGAVPQTISSPAHTGHRLLALGGEFKGTFSILVDDRIFVSHHLGEMDDFRNLRQMEQEIGQIEILLGIHPTGMVHDWHPDFSTTRSARVRCAREGLPCWSVGHHHAHMASCLAEHQCTGPAIGVTFDGTGWGADGTIWGGEFLVGGLRSAHRFATFRPVALPGGDQAAREPWRMAAAHLFDAGCAWESLNDRIPTSQTRNLERILQGGLGPRTSSVGRLFDAVACLLGLGDRNGYESQAAVALEQLAATDVSGGKPRNMAFPFTLEFAGVTEEPVPSTLGWQHSEKVLVVDTRPMMRSLEAELRGNVPIARLARRFHTTLATIVAEVCRRARAAHGIHTVALSGGVFLNNILRHEVEDLLRRDDFEVLVHREIPCNDAGLSVGQVVVAAACLE